MSADELIHEYGMTMPKTQYEWIVNFSNLWEKIQNAD